MSVPTVLENRLSSLRDSVVQKAKGGEKEMESEWERLEKLSKDELIIELVKERTARRNVDRALRSITDVEYPVDRRYSVYGEDYDSNYEAASDDWAYKIAFYAFKHSDGDFSPYDLESYGLDSDQSMEAYRKLRVNGIVSDTSYDQDGWFRWLARLAASIAIPIMKLCRLQSKRMLSESLSSSADPVIIMLFNRIWMARWTLPSLILFLILPAVLVGPDVARRFLE